MRGSRRRDGRLPRSSSHGVFIAILDSENDLVASSSNPVRIAPGEIASVLNRDAIVTGPTRCEVAAQVAGGEILPLKGSARTLHTTLCALDANGKCSAAVSAP